MRSLSNDYFFFFFPVFFAFVAFFAFFAMLPSVIPKVGSMQVDIDMHRCRVHHICKIYSSSFEEGKRRSPHRDESGSQPAFFAARLLRPLPSLSSALRTCLNSSNDALSARGNCRPSVSSVLTIAEPITTRANHL